MRANGVGTTSLSGRTVPGRGTSRIGGCWHLRRLEFGGSVNGERVGAQVEVRRGAGVHDLAREDELGAVHLGYGANGRVFANITTPTQPNRRGALTFVLDTRQDGITIRQVQRVHARGNYGIGSTVKTTPPRDTPIDEQLRRARTDRDQAGAALRAADQQKRDPDSGHATDDTTHSRNDWRKVVTDLDREIRTLGQRRQARDQIDPPGRSR